MDNLSTYSNSSLVTTVPPVNSTYLNNTHIQLPADPLSGSTMGIMMLLSTLQYQAPYMSPTYSNAASQAAHAAFIDVGGQAFQDKTNSKVSDIATKTFLDAAHSVGVTDTELAIVAGTAKTFRDRGFNVNGPKIYGVKTNLTGNQNSGSLGLKYEW